VDEYSHSYVELIMLISIRGRQDVILISRGACLAKGLGQYANILIRPKGRKYLELM
jgi:hypothetical protein